MSCIFGITRYVITTEGPSKALSWDSNSLILVTLNNNKRYVAGYAQLISPMYKTLAELQDAYPEYFI